MALLHRVLLLCKRLPNDRPLSSSQVVWAEYELMLCNMTVIIPLGEPAVLRGAFSFSFPKFPSLFCYHLPFSPSSVLLSTVAFALSACIQTFLWGSLCLTALYLLYYEIFVVCCKVWPWMAASGCCVTEEPGSIRNDFNGPKKWVNRMNKYKWKKIYIFETFMCLIISNSFCYSACKQRMQTCIPAICIHHKSIANRVNHKPWLFSVCQPKLLLIKVVSGVLFSQAYQQSTLCLTRVQRQQGAAGFHVPAIMMPLYCL